MVSPKWFAKIPKGHYLFVIHLGRYVVIQNFVKTQAPHVLTLCEVEIMGGGFSISHVMLKRHGLGHLIPYL